MKICTSRSLNLCTESAAFKLCILLMTFIWLKDNFRQLFKNWYYKGEISKAEMINEREREREITPSTVFNISEKAFAIIWWGCNLLRKVVHLCTFEHHFYFNHYSDHSDHYRDTKMCFVQWSHIWATGIITNKRIPSLGMLQIYEQSQNHSTHFPRWQGTAEKPILLLQIGPITRMGVGEEKLHCPFYVYAF